MGPSLAEVAAREPREDAVEPRQQGGSDSPHRRPRFRVPGQAESGHHRQEQFPWRCGREYGTLQLHLEEALGSVLRAPLFLHVVQRQERRLRGRRVPAEGCPPDQAAQDVSLANVM